MAVAEIFKALGDPVRLEMVRRLSGGGSYTMGSVSSELGITRQGARKHLQILAQAKLITLKSKGREVSVQLDRPSFDAAKDFIITLEKKWDIRLEALREFVEKDGNFQ
jgi:DNA-binding transcriptional ArsR family regulator